MVRFAVRKFELIYNFELYHEPFEFKYNSVVVQKICCLFFYILNDGKKDKFNFQADKNHAHNVGGDTCSWKGQFERTRSRKVLSWKVWSWKVRSWKVSLMLERAKRSWKEPSEVGKNRAKFQRTDCIWLNRSWKVSFEVEKFHRSWKVWMNSFFPTALSNYTYPRWSHWDGAKVGLLPG